MKLDPGSTPDKPSVSKTSTRAIIWVMIEVCLFTALFGFVVNALTGLQVKGDEVNAPGQEGVRDYILRSMAQIFVSHSLGATAGSIAATERDAASSMRRSGRFAASIGVGTVTM